jgi:trans-aconitate methyltransferase
VTDAAAPEATVSQEHFIGLYLAKTDPWDNETSWHNRRKYAVALASLPRERYRSAYEPGCSVGMLTRLLAERCDRLLAVDCVDEAVETARASVQHLRNVRVEAAMLPADLPAATFDLIVIGDLLYYLSADDLEALLDGLVERLEPGGDLVSVHFRDRQTAGTYDGGSVHETLATRPGLERVIRHEDEWFVLDVLRRAAAV